MKKIKVLILGNTDVGSFFKNGLYQNAWSLARMLDKSGEFDVSLTSATSSGPKDVLGIKSFKNDMELMKKQDIIIQIAYSLSNKEALTLQKSGVKLILIKYGNNLGSDLETYVQYSLNLKPRFDLNEWFRLTYTFTPDLLLYSPHYEFQKQYISLTTGVSEENTKQCPYIWNPFFINSYSTLYRKKLGEKYNLTFKKGDKRNQSLACVEPNIGFMKSNLIPIIMMNEVHKESPGLIKHGFVFNSKSLKNGENGKVLGQRLNSLKAFADKVLSLESREPMIDILANKARVLVSHQIMNALNYTHFEFALNGYPFVHNSEMLSSYGYYYKENNVLDGKERLKEALQHEHLSSKELQIYNNGCEEMIWNHAPDNPKNISGYIDLVKSVL
jgi:hypothetical protein